MICLWFALVLVTPHDQVQELVQERLGQVLSSMLDTAQKKENLLVFIVFFGLQGTDSGEPQAC